MSAAPASSVEAGVPGWQEAGSLQRFCPPGARPFLSRGLSRAPLAPPVTIHRSQSARAPSFRWIVRWCLLLLLLVLGADAPGHCHCLDAPTVLVQWQNSPRLSHSSFLSSLLIPHPGLCVADGTRRPFLYPTNQQSHPPAPSAAPQQSPNPPEPTHDQGAFLLSLPPHARLTTAHLSLTHLLLFVPLSLSPSLSSPSLPAHKSPIPQGGSFRFGPPSPPSPPTYQDKTFSYDSEDVGLSATRRRKEGLTHLVSSHLVVWPFPVPVPIAGTTNKHRTPARRRDLSTRPDSSEGGGGGHSALGRQRHPDCLSALGLPPPPPVFSKVVFPRLARLARLHS